MAREQSVLGAGAVQPSLLRRRDGTLVAYMRDNGPPPNRVFVAYSRDDGETWTEAEKTSLPNPGSSVAALALRTGEWLLIGNDTEQGRHQLAVWLSEDEGRNWRLARHLERDEVGRGRYAYPCAIQARDGTIHVSYSYALERDDLPRDEQGRPKRSAIKWAHFSREWLLQGNQSRLGSP